MTRIPYSHPALAASVVALLALGASLATSLAASEHITRTVFFPRLAGRPPEQAVRFVAEERLVPERRGLEGNVAGLVDEMLLGPEDPESRPLASPGTRLLAVDAGGGSVYVSLTRELLDEGSVLPPERQVQVMADTIYYNFPSTRRVFILVDGQEPDFSSTTGDPSYDFRRGVPRSDLLLD